MAEKARLGWEKIWEKRAKSWPSITSRVVFLVIWLVGSWFMVAGGWEVSDQ